MTAGGTRPSSIRLPSAYLFPLWDPKRQTFADKLMGTVVLSGIPKQRLTADVLRI